MKNIEIKFDFNGFKTVPSFQYLGEKGSLRGTTNVVNKRYFNDTSLTLDGNSSKEEIAQWKEEFKVKATNWILNKKIA